MNISYDADLWRTTQDSELIKVLDDLRAEVSRLETTIENQDETYQAEKERIAFLESELDQAYTKLRAVAAALEKSTNLLDELLFDQFVVLGQEYTRKVIYQIAENQAVMALEPTEIGEK